MRMRLPLARFAKARRFGWLGLLVALAVTGAGGARAAGADARHGGIRPMHMISAALHGASRSVRVYLPPSYDRPESAGRRYPVLLLLHGWPGGDGNWPGRGRCGETLDSLSAAGAIPEMIALIPNGSGAGSFGRSIWLNSADGKSPIEDFVAFDLVAWADTTFRTETGAAHRTVIGLSDGGTAAFNLLMRHPEIFGAAGSLSGRFHLRHEMGMNAALIGSGAAADRFLAENSPALRVESEGAALRGARLYVDCGTGDSELEDNRAFHERLLQAGVPNEYHEYPGGHGWGYWRQHLDEALIALTGTRRTEDAAPR